MTTLIICASLAIVAMFALGYIVGYRLGEADGIARHAKWTRARRCA